VAVPPEFGSQDYNHHHFHYGYVLYAAAVLGEADESFVEEYRSVVDLLVWDVAGSAAAPGDCGASLLPGVERLRRPLGRVRLPAFRRRQQSGVLQRGGARMGAHGPLGPGQRGDADGGGGSHPLLLGGRHDTALLAARGGNRLEGFDHTVIGILWGGKTDYATVFHPAPEAVEGIQLLPLTMGSFYRFDPDAASARAAELEESVGRAPRTWG
jgi:endo-1,3(4)-beta-glucanase